ncbi:MAG: T9SS C-terminal target domain-containing protein [Bacteroidetes bacterium]|nr:MAG: T9SS C-terminal target domain-containing protein [Bacteroidota bacterium]
MDKHSQSGEPAPGSKITGILLLCLFLLSGGVLPAQSFFRTYPNTLIDSEITEGVYVHKTADGFVIGVGGQYTREFEGIITTDSDGNMISSTDFNFPYDFGDAPEYPRLALSNGNLLRHKVDTSNHQVVYEILTGAGDVVSSFSIPYPAGDIVGTSNGSISIRGIGKSAEYADGDIFVSFYHGAPWNSVFDIPARTIVYAKVNPISGAIAWMNSFQGEPNRGIALPRLLAVAEDQSIFMSHVEELPINQLHYLEKISPTGELLWKDILITLERQPLQFAPSDADGGVWYYFSQSVYTVSKSVGDGMGGFKLAASFLPDAAFQNGSHQKGAIIPAPDGGVLVAGTVIPNGSTERVMFTMLADSSGNVTKINYFENMPQLLIPKRGIRLPTGAYVIVGALDPTPESFYPYDQIPFMIKVDANGSFTPTTTCADNLLGNPGFEDGLNGWNAVGGVSLSSDANTGVGAARLGGNGFASLGQAVPTTPGTKYTAKAWAKQGSAGFHTLELRFLNSAFITLPGAAQVNVDAADYTEYVLNGTAPADASYVYVIATTDGNGSMALDDVCLTTGGGTPVCDISSNISNIQCNNNGTPANPADDTFSFVLSATNPLPGAGFLVTIQPAGLNFQGTYGTPLTIPDIPISMGNLDISITDNQTNGCLDNISVSPPAPCSNGGGGGEIDLSLTLEQLAVNPPQWSNYMVKLTVMNSGPQAATGVKVHFAKPDGVVYTGGNEYSASQGSFQVFGDEVWTVGDIPVNGSATLTVSYFLLTPAPPVAYAQVIAHNETDNDSQPDNGTPPTPNEDDEAATSGGGTPNPLPDLRITNLQIQNPAIPDGGDVMDYLFDVGNIGTKAVTADFTIKAWLSTDDVLSADDIQDGTISTGNYGVGFAANNVPGSSVVPGSLAPGTYYLIVKIDADDAIAESNENNNIAIQTFTVGDGGGGTGCDAVSMVADPGQITISGANAPHVLIKVFKPNWQVAFECLDGGCTNPLVVSGLGAGSHYVEIKLMDAAWTTICETAQTLQVMDVNGNPINALKINTDRQRLSFDKVYPNPAQYQTTLEMYSQIDQSVTLEFYNLHGQMIHRREVSLRAGKNNIELDVTNWISGIYHIIGKGNGHPAYARFMKIWE